VSFLSNQDLENDVLRAFSKVCGVKTHEVETEANSTQMRLKTIKQLKDETREVELIIKLIKLGESPTNNKFHLIGYIHSSGKVPKKWDIDQEYVGTPHSLPSALRKVLAHAKVKRTFLGSYFS